MEKGVALTANISSGISHNDSILSNVPNLVSRSALNSNEIAQDFQTLNKTVMNFSCQKVLFRTLKVTIRIWFTFREIQALLSHYF